MQRLCEVRLTLPITLWVSPCLWYRDCPAATVVGIVTTMTCIHINLQSAEVGACRCIFARSNTSSLLFSCCFKTLILCIDEDSTLHLRKIAHSIGIDVARDIADMVNLIMSSIKLLHTRNLVVVQPFWSIHASHRTDIVTIDVTYECTITSGYIDKMFAIWRYTCPEITCIISIRSQYITAFTVGYQHLLILDANGRLCYKHGSQH